MADTGNLAQKKIALSGAGGFLGRHILSTSDGYGCEVFALSSQTEKMEEQFSGREELHFLGRDDFDVVEWSDIDVLINCAFPRNTDGAAIADGLRYIERLLVTAVENGVRAVINISSQSVYSQKRLCAADENEPLNLESAYAVGKYATELMTNSICKSIPHTNLRMASLMGVGFDQRIVNKFVKAAAAGETIRITGGEQLFGFLDVRDAAEAVLTAAGRPECWEEIFNLGTNDAYTLIEITECVVRMGKGLGYDVPEPEITPSDVWQNSALCCDSFMAGFAWRPEYDLETTVHSLFEALS